MGIPSEILWEWKFHSHDTPLHRVTRGPKYVTAARNFKINWKIPVQCVLPLKDSSSMSRSNNSIAESFLGGRKIYFAVIISRSVVQYECTRNN